MTKFAIKTEIYFIVSTLNVNESRNGIVENAH